MIKSNYTVVEDTQFHVTIEDLGPWDEYMSVTNNVEKVLLELHLSGIIKGKRLFYIDSERRKDEICHDGKGNFEGFR